MRIRLTLLFCAILAAVLFSGTEPAESQASRKEIEKIFEKIAKHFAANDADKIAKRLPTEGKVKLALRGITGSKAYRKQQAHALLKKHFDAIESKQFKRISGPHHLTTQYRHTYRIRSEDETVKAYVVITLGRENNQWVIIEILED